MPTEYLCKQCIIILALCSCKIKLLDGVTMDEKEQIPAGIITMLLKGYVETIAFQRKLICAALIGWVATAIAFICMQVGDNKMDTLLKNTRDWLQTSTRRSFNAAFIQRGIGGGKDNTTTGRNLRTEICERLDQLSDSSGAECIC